jgi:hypothetical protein
MDERGQVIRGGMLELAGKELEFLLYNEVLLVEGFLAGVKSKDLTYLWSDFVSRPLDGTQADGRVVALQREGGAKSRLNAEALRTEFCIDWYWVYSSNGVVVYEVYSHTTCSSASCDSNAHDACLDDGIGGGGDEGQITYKIENNVKSPCISGQVNKAVDSQFKNQITSLINSAFGESEKFDIILEDNNLNDNSLDGITGVSFTETVMTFTITLNSEVLTSSSQEYILATVFHELLHAYMGHLGIDKSSISIDHENMANNYLNMLSKALMEHYSISGTNANYLAWGGLHESSKWVQLSQDQKNQILQTNHEYRSGVKGVKCK